MLAPGKNRTEIEVWCLEVSSGDATRVAETLPPCRLETPTRASALLPPHSTSHTTPLRLQVTLTTEPAAGFVYLAASRCRCRYAVTSPLTAYPGPIHWSHISDDIFHDHLHSVPQPSTQSSSAYRLLANRLRAPLQHRSLLPITLWYGCGPVQSGNCRFAYLLILSPLLSPVYLDNVQALSPGPRIASQRSKLSIPTGRLSGFAFTPPTHNTHEFAYQSRRHNTQRHVEVCEANDANQGSI